MHIYLLSTPIGWRPTKPWKAIPNFYLGRTQTIRGKTDTPAGYMRHRQFSCVTDNFRASLIFLKNLLNRNQHFQSGRRHIHYYLITNVNPRLKNILVTFLSRTKTAFDYIDSNTGCRKRLFRVVAKLRLVGLLFAYPNVL